MRNAIAALGSHNSVQGVYRSGQKKRVVAAPSKSCQTRHLPFASYAAACEERIWNLSFRCWTRGDFNELGVIDEKLGTPITRRLLAVADLRQLMIAISLLAHRFGKDVTSEMMNVNYGVCIARAITTAVSVGSKDNLARGYGNAYVPMIWVTKTLFSVEMANSRNLHLMVKSHVGAGDVFGEDVP